MKCCLFNFYQILVQNKVSFHSLICFFFVFHIFITEIITNFFLVKVNTIFIQKIILLSTKCLAIRIQIYGLRLSSPFICRNYFDRKYLKYINISVIPNVSCYFYLSFQLVIPYRILFLFCPDILSCIFYFLNVMKNPVVSCQSYTTIYVKKKGIANICHKKKVV